MIKINKNAIRYLLLNCFTLLIPILLLNVLYADKLPAAYQMDFFWEDIPWYIAIIENISRIVVFVLPLILRLEFKSQQQKVGFAIYIIGVLLYFLSWMMQILYPDSDWSTSVFGFMAPAYSTILWLLGIGLIGVKSWLKIPYHYLVYIFVAFIFVVFHSIHSYIVFDRI